MVLEEGDSSLNTYVWFSGQIMDYDEGFTWQASWGELRYPHPIWYKANAL